VRKKGGPRRINSPEHKKKPRFFSKGGREGGGKNMKPSGQLAPIGKRKGYVPFKNWGGEKRGQKKNPFKGKGGRGDFQCPSFLREAPCNFAIEREKGE